MIKVLFLASKASGPMRVGLPRGATTLNSKQFTTHGHGESIVRSMYVFIYKGTFTSLVG